MADSQQQNSNPDEPLDLSSTGKQCLENSTDEQYDPSSNKLEAALSTDIEKSAISATDQQTLTYGKHRLPINEVSKHSLCRGIQLRKSKQTLVTFARAESQVNNDHAEKSSSSRISESAVGSVSEKNFSPQDESQLNNDRAEKPSSSQTTGSAASPPSKINAFPQVESGVNNDQAEKASDSQASELTAGSSYKGNTSPQVKFQVNIDHAEKASSSQAPELAANSPSKINAFPQVESRVNNDQVEKASNSQASQLAAGSSYTGNASPQVQFQVNIDQAEKASSSLSPESAAGSSFLQKSPKSFRFSEEQLEILIEAYEKNENPSYSTKMKLASELNLEYNQVYNWFYRRLRDPKKGASKQAAATPKPPPRKWTQCRRWEQDLLEVEFKKNPYPTPKVQNEMSEKINLSTYEVVQWFKHRRKIEKKKRNQPPPESTKQEPD